MLYEEKDVDKIKSELHQEHHLLLRKIDFFYTLYDVLLIQDLIQGAPVLDLLDFAWVQLDDYHNTHKYTPLDITPLWRTYRDSYGNQ